MDTLDQKNAMNNLTRIELNEIDGGASLSGTLVSAFTSAFKTVFDFGRSLGSAFRRIKEGKLCAIS